ncbi:UDP-4-amino-4,6-dideoxy-N-acetyl-beta-L-altrosami ne transaminase [Bowmanella denitrificans]|uniref:UDP-4-amino-4, 6-dideoxy-N-acetyl-beta-L-altrosami ne transaminase n=1 Tax=Bowmanella denitrificans TaxID=366582 RepID=A0ABP3HC28_9ALTE
MIPYGKHQIDQEDLAAVIDVLQNQLLTQGQQVPVFESALKNYCGAAHATAVNSGTSALHIACLALNVAEGDLVWTSPNSFVASANCARYCGAQIDFVDIDPITRNLSVEALAQKLEKAKQANRLPKAIIMVHFAGMSCDMRAIHALTAPLGIALIEDASHALGGRYLDKPVGGCQFSDVCILSFHPVKSITTAEGGAVLTNSATLAEKLRLFASHGITRAADLMDVESEGPWYYQQIALGYNYRLSDLHAALGVSQLRRLDSFIAKRRELVQIYREKLAGLPLVLPLTSSDSAWHLFTVELRQHDRSEIFARLQKAGIGVNVHYIPIHLQPYYRKLGFRPGDFPYAEAYYQNALTLPLYPGLSVDNQQYVIDTLISILG